MDDDSAVAKLRLLKCIASCAAELFDGAHSTAAQEILTAAHRACVSSVTGAVMARTCRRDAKLLAASVLVQLHMLEGAPSHRLVGMCDSGIAALKVPAGELPFLFRRSACKLPPRVLAAHLIVRPA